MSNNNKESMNFRIVFYLAVLIGVLTFTSCEKEEGQGGTSTIRGRVMVKQYDREFKVLRSTYPMQNEDVFIIYGSNEIYGDRFRTDYDGYYEFNYLQKGSYRIFAYSKDSLLNYDDTDKMIPVFKDVEISGKDQKVIVEDIYVLK